MNWQGVVRPEAGDDIFNAAAWYGSRQQELGEEFVEEVIAVFEALAENPLLNCRRHSRKNIRWRYPKRFPYRVVYEVDETAQLVVVAAILHAARDDRRWKRRVV